MESRMMPIRCHRGFMLITVLIITMVALLFGAGTLLIFRFQCQLRIDRQHQLEKVYAVRSVLNYLRGNICEIPEDGKSFRCGTGSGRDLRLIAKHVEPIFPSTNYVKNVDGRMQRHFFMERGDFSIPSGGFVLNSGANGIGFYDKSYDYDCGACGVTNLLIRNGSYVGGTKTLPRTYWGLEFYDTNVTFQAAAKWWINIGMPGTGGWLQEEYGRRYYFLPKDYFGGTGAKKDIVRLCLIRNVTNETDATGRTLPEGSRHGWPLSQNGEKALVFQIYQQESDVAEMKVSEYAYPIGERKTLLCLTNQFHLNNIGIQLAHTNLWMFYIENEKPNTVAADDFTSRGYNFLGRANISDEIYRYFKDPQEIGGKTYNGLFKDDRGVIHASELRAVFEVEGVSDSRIENAVVADKVDAFTRFRVTPAYQYDVMLEFPLGSDPQRATVAQKIGKYDYDALQYTVLTYDTHGTENKGFRRDEREAERKRIGR